MRWTIHAGKHSISSPTAMNPNSAQELNLRQKRPKSRVFPRQPLHILSVDESHGSYLRLNRCRGEPSCYRKWLFRSATRIRIRGAEEYFALLILESVERLDFQLNGRAA